jgi:hypothetical protein
LPSTLHPSHPPPPLLLVRYGTLRSTDVRATSCNPWGSLFLATTSLTLAWVLTPIRSWARPYAVNAMLIALQAGIVVTLSLVDLNLTTLEEWAAVLQARWLGQGPKGATCDATRTPLPRPPTTTTTTAESQRGRDRGHGGQRQSDRAGGAAAAAQTGGQGCRCCCRCGGGRRRWQRQRRCWHEQRWSGIWQRPRTRGRRGACARSTAWQRGRRQLAREHG